MFLPNHSYVWKEAVPEEDVKDCTNVRLTRVSTDVLLCGPTALEQVKCRILHDQTSLEVTVDLQETFCASRRTAVRVASLSGIAENRMANAIDQVSAMTRVCGCPS